MKTFSLHRRAAAFVSALALIAPGAALAQTAAPTAPAAPAAVRSDAREQVPAALLGIWEADIAASTYTSAPPRQALRIFQYSEDAKVLVTFITVNTAGATTYGHWAAAVDGSEAMEYHSSYGATPYNTVTLKKVDERNLNLTVARNGHLDMTGSYQLSEDGKVLTYKYAYGERATTIIYRPWVPAA